MRTITAALALVLASGAMAHAAPADDAVATVHAFVAAFDKGDMKGAAAVFEPDAAIIDEVGAHQWHGTGALGAWGAALEKDGADRGLTDEAVTLGKTVRAEAVGDAAYVVVEATFTYKQKGAPIAEPATMVYALKKEAGGWMIAAWAWSGTAPKPAS